MKPGSEQEDMGSQSGGKSRPLGQIISRNVVVVIRAQGVYRAKKKTHLKSITSMTNDKILQYWPTLFSLTRYLNDNYTY